MSGEKKPLAVRVEQLRAALKNRDPGQLAAQTGTELHQPPADGDYFTFPYWGNPIRYPTRDLIAREQDTGEALSVLDQAMVAYYFHESKGSPPPQGWIAFSELPDGQFYSSAFRGYTAQKLSRTFGNSRAEFEKKCQALAGKPVSFATTSYRFQVFPKVAVLAVYWQGDEDFPSTYQILFQDTAHLHLPTDGCAILGSILTGRLLS